MELKSNTKFGKDLTQQYLNGFINLTDYQRMRSNVDDFLEQPLALWMFVPCGDDGNPFEEDGTDTDGYVLDDVMFKEYQQAKERCLFEGFELIKTENPEVDGLLLYGEETIYPEDFNTIEDLVKYSPTLTQSAINQITK